MKIQIIAILAFLLFECSNTSAQFLLENNNAESKASQRVKMETGYYLMPDGQKCLMWVKEFDRNGYMTKYRDHWQCGQPYWTYDYEYNEAGQCIKSWKSAYLNGFKRVQMEHHYNAKGFLIDRVLRDPTLDDAHESFTYNSDQKIILIDHWRMVNGKKNIFKSRNWNGETEYKMTQEEEVKSQGVYKWTVIREFELHSP